MDILTLIGVIIGFAAIIGGNFLEGGHIDALLNGPAAIIVLGGTIGAAVHKHQRMFYLSHYLYLFGLLSLPLKIFLKFKNKLLNGLRSLEKKWFIRAGKSCI